MSNSNHNKIHWLLVIAEILLFISAIVSAYFSQMAQWSNFLWVSVTATAIFIALKVIEAVPTSRQLMARENFAAKIATAAGSYGVIDYFNMQSPIDQSRRNECAQTEIKKASTLWLCANSGSSYLDPSVYRHWPFIESRLNSGAEFRVVLLDPLSNEKAFRNQINVGGENFDSKINIANLIKLTNNFPGLEIRFAKHGMHATVFGNEHSLFFDPYQVGIVGDRIENRSFSLQILQHDPDEGIGLYRLFKSHFDTLWRSGISLERWLVENHGLLPIGLPIIRTRL